MLTEHMLLNNLSYMKLAVFLYIDFLFFFFSPDRVSLVQKQLNISLDPGLQERVVALMEATPFMENYTGCDRSLI